MARIEVVEYRLVEIDGAGKTASSRSNEGRRSRAEGAEGAEDN
jgi:hypothetical protein